MINCFEFNKLCSRPPQYAPAPCQLTVAVLILKVVSESHVTWATSVPILVILGHSVLDLGPMYVTDRRQTKASLNAPPIRGGGIIIRWVPNGHLLYLCLTALKC